MVQEQAALLARKKIKKEKKKFEKALAAEIEERKKQTRWSWYHWNMRKRALKAQLDDDKIICALQRENQELQSKVDRLTEGATHSMDLRPRKRVRYI